MERQVDRWKDRQMDAKEKFRWIDRPIDAQEEDRWKYR
jgi:hypothetical protein